MKYHSTPFFEYVYSLYTYELARRVGKVFKKINETDPDSFLTTEGEGIRDQLEPPDFDYRHPDLERLRKELGLEITGAPERVNLMCSFGDHESLMNGWRVTINGEEDDDAITTLFNELSVGMSMKKMFLAIDGEREDEFVGIVDCGHMNMGHPFLGIVRHYYTAYEPDPDPGSSRVVTRSKLVAGFITGNVADIVLSHVIGDSGNAEEFELLNGVRVERLTYSEACQKLVNYWKTKYPEHNGEIVVKVGEAEYRYPSFYKQLEEI